MEEKKHLLVNYRESNALITAINPKLSPLAKRIIALTVLLTNKSKIDNHIIQVPATAMIKLLGFSPKYPNFNNIIHDVFKYELSKAILISKYGKPISENEDLSKREYTGFSGWISEYHYSPKTGLFSFAIAPSLAKLYLNYKSNFTIFNLAIDNCMEKNKYANRLYKYFKKEAFKYEHNSTTWEWRFRVEDLRIILGIPEEKYTVFANLRRKVIEPAVDTINKYSEFKLTFEGELVGKAIGNIVFTISKKTEEEENKRWDILKEETDIEEITKTLLKLEQLNNIKIIDHDVLEKIENEEEQTIE